jgi:RimJ/RimL family protein N-acetyltransferase
MLRGELVGLRGKRPDDVPILHAELYEDVVTRSRSDTRPWTPISAESGNSPFGLEGRGDDAAAFTIVTLSDDEVVGGAVLWGIDSHNRLAHIGVSLIPASRGHGYGADVVAVLCHYGFVVRGMHRLQIETLSDNAAMIRAAEKSGFAVEGTLSESGWVMGKFQDEVILGLVETNWTPAA